MRDKEIVGLWEAYQQVCSPQELTEEVEIASHYFYEMGLNEDGVNILIEDLGLGEFVEFVYDIAEEYVLTEARAGGAKIKPVTTKGQQFKSGKPTGKSLERLRAQKEARRGAESEASESKPSGMKASLQRQSAVSAAAKKQPKKPGLLDSVANAVIGGFRRHNAAMGELKKMTAATKETAGKVGKAAGEFKKGFMGEEVENWVNALVEEGYDLSEYTWDDMYEMYVEEVERLVEDEKYDRNRRRAAQRAAERNEARREGRTGNVPGVGYVSPRPEGSTYTDSAGVVRHHTGGRMPQKEELDLFDYILEYLVAEGYADTNENAIAIMSNMSEEWRESIVEDAPLRDEPLWDMKGDKPKLPVVKKPQLPVKTEPPMRDKPLW